MQRVRSQFPDFEEELYAEIEAHGSLRRFAAGDTLLRTGQTFRAVLLILEGVVKLYREDDEGNEFLIYHLGPGQACSLSFVCTTRNLTSSVLARALSDATVLSVPFAQMDRWMLRYRSWYQFVIQTYRERFEELLRTVDAIAFSNMDERLEYYLRRQVEQVGNPIRLTHQEIANDLNSSREVVSRLLKKMESKHWVIIHRNAVEWIGRPELP